MRNGGHAYLVVGAREKTCESRCKRNLAHRRKPHGSADHILLGYEALEEPVGMGLHEFLGISRILRVAVKGDYSRVHFSESSERVSVSLARGNLLPQSVRNLSGRSALAAALRSFTARSSFGRFDFQDFGPTGFRLKLGDGAVGLFTFLERLSVPAFFVFNE